MQHKECADMQVSSASGLPVPPSAISQQQAEGSSLASFLGQVAQGRFALVAMPGMESCIHSWLLLSWHDVWDEYLLATPSFCAHPCCLQPAMLLLVFQECISA